MENYLWLVYALLSAVAAAMVSVFGKIGLQGLDAHTATAVRAVIMAAFLVAVAVFQRRWEHLPELWADKRAMTFILLSGVAGALSWLVLFYGIKIRQGFPSGPGGQVERRFGGHGGGCLSA